MEDGRSLAGFRVVGILLAAGRGQRFDPSGRQNKLLASCDGGCVVTNAARNLCAVLPEVLAVVRAGDEAMVEALRATGCSVVHCADSEQGLSASLQAGLGQAASADGWLITLGDMPFVQPSTMQALLHALSGGADIAVPIFQNRRGNPVAFSRKHLSALMRLQGDQGARALLATHAVCSVLVDDPGILHDIDTRADLAQAI